MLTVTPPAVSSGGHHADHRLGPSLGRCHRHVVAFFAIREIRAKRRGPDEFDRLTHEATREADLRSHTQGPNGFNQTWG